MAEDPGPPRETEPPEGAESPRRSEAGGGDRSPPETPEPAGATVRPRPATLAASRTYAGLRAVRTSNRAERLRSLLETANRMRVLLGLRLGQHVGRIARDDHVYLVLMATVVGVAAGAAAGLLLAWIEWAHDKIPAPDEDAALRSLLVFVVPALGGLAVGVLRVGVGRLLRRRVVEGAPGVLEAVAVRRGEIAAADVGLSGLGAGLSIATGASVGHEGPSVAIGAGVGSVLARFFGLGMRRKIAMVGAGAASGIAAAFNAPLAGVLFATEILFGHVGTPPAGGVQAFVPLAVAAVASTFTSYAVFGARPEFDVGTMAPPNVAEVVPYLVLALLAGGIGGTFLRVVQRIERIFKRLPPWAAPAAGGLGVGAVAALVGSNAILGPGVAAVDAGLHGALSWKVAGLLVAGKIVATAVAVASGAFGGVFMPSLVVGAALGTLVGAVAVPWVGDPAVGTVPYALVGMGAVFAALMQAPLTPIVMIFELTRQYTITLPLMLTCILAALVARRLGAEPYYRGVLHGRGVTLPDEREDRVIRRARVGDLMVPPTRVLPREASLAEVEEAVVEADMQTVFVVAGDRDVVGAIDGRQLARRIVAGQVEADSTAGALAERRFPMLVPEDTVAGAILAFARSDLDLLPVTDAQGRLLGVLRRADVLARYSDELLSREEGSLEVRTPEGVHEEVELGEGVILDRWVVPARLAGKTLADLDLRGRCGVLVVEWRRDGGPRPVDPAEPLAAGDVLALVGRREQILAVRALGAPA